MPHFSPATILLLILVALLLFGPKKLPELGRAFGNTLREFKKGTKEMMIEEDDDTQIRKEIQHGKVGVHEIAQSEKGPSGNSD